MSKYHKALNAIEKAQHVCAELESRYQKDLKEARDTQHAAAFAAAQEFNRLVRLIAEQRCVPLPDSVHLVGDTGHYSVAIEGDVYDVGVTEGRVTRINWLRTEKCIYVVSMSATAEVTGYLRVIASSPEEAGELAKTNPGAVVWNYARLCEGEGPEVTCVKMELR